MGSKDVTLAYDDDTKETIGSKDVTLAYDDDAQGKMGSKDVTLAYDDDAKGNMGSKDVTLALLRKDWELFLKSIVSSQYNFGQMVEYYIHLFIGITI